MAGSFEIFRKYQRSLLVFVAILAMLAFFVLPPFLQLGSGFAAGDPVVATWRGGELRESGLARAVAMRTVLNRFLFEAVAAAGRDPSQMRPLSENEEDVVRTMVLAGEARANGIVVSNAAINRLLGQMTGDMVKPEQFEELIDRLRSGPFAVSQGDVFEALRTVYLADLVRRLFLVGFTGDPPGQRWDYFRRLEQEANLEVVPVPVAGFLDQVPPPPQATLQAFFARYKEALPEVGNPEPGFKEPQRVSIEYLVAPRAELEAEALGKVTDEEVKADYEKNKDQRYKVKPPAADEAKPESEPEAKPGEPSASIDPAEAETDPKPVATGESSTASEPEPKPEAEAKPAPEPEAEAKPAPEPEAEPKPESPGTEKPVAEATYEPLEKVAADIRRRLAADAVRARVEEIFTEVNAEISRYAEQRVLFEAEVTTGAPPQKPDIERIARENGLVAGKLERVSRLDVTGTGGLAGTFEFVPDRRSPMGFRQVAWPDQVFVPDSRIQILRPTLTTDSNGDRYVWWKTEERASFVPGFSERAADVEQAWRAIEARPLARKAAEALVKAAGAGTLAEAVGPEPQYEARSVGPFTWMQRSPQSFGSAPEVAEPEGLELPGEAFMEAVFALEPGGTTVVFNRPRTICYAVRLVGYEPDEATLRERFLDIRTDQRRLVPLAQEEEEQALEAWITAVERGRDLSWKRPPRGR